MVRFKKKPPGSSEGRAGQLKVLKQLSEYEFGVEIEVMRDGLNNNNWDYRNVAECYQTFLGTPILCAYVGGKVGDGHNMREKIDPKTGEMYYSFTDGTAERIVGTISEDPKDLTLKERDGHTWIVAKGRLWSFYAPELVDKIVRTGRMDVSAETQVIETETDGDIEIYTRWAGIGVTILGDQVSPAVPGANIAALAAMQDEFNKAKLRAASLRESSAKKQAATKRTKKGVKSNMRNKQAMARMEKKFEGYRIVALSEDNMRVAMVDKAGVPYTYTFLEEDKGDVVEARITPANLSVSFAFGAETEALSADLADILDYAVSEAVQGMKEKEKEVEGLTAELEEAKKSVSALADMKEKERKRRIQSVKDTIKLTAEEIAAAAEDDDEEVEEEAKEMCDNAESYADMECDGEFCGDKKARAELMAACSEKRIKKAKKLAANKNSFAWDMGVKGGGRSEGGIEEMLAHINN